jgi:hypothetical protein
MIDMEAEEAHYKRFVAAGILIPAKVKGSVLDLEPLDLGHTAEEIEAALNWVRADRF